MAITGSLFMAVTNFTEIGYQNVKEFLVSGKHKCSILILSYTEILEKFGWNHPSSVHIYDFSLGSSKFHWMSPAWSKTNVKHIYDLNSQHPLPYGVKRKKCQKTLEHLLRIFKSSAINISLYNFRSYDLFALYFHFRVCLNLASSKHWVKFSRISSINHL